MVHLVINTLIDKNTILDCDIYFQIEKLMRATTNDISS